MPRCLKTQTVLEWWSSCLLLTCSYSNISDSMWRQLLKFRLLWSRQAYPWHPPSPLSLSSLLSTQSLAPPPVLSQLWVAVTPPCRAVPAAAFPLWVRATSEASIQNRAPSGTTPWSLFPVTCGPLLRSTWHLPTCTSTTADRRSTPWTRSAPSTTAAPLHTHTTTRIPTLMPTRGWTAIPTGRRPTTTHPFTALTTSPTAGLSLQLCRPNPTYERAASPRRSCPLSQSRCPAGSSTPLTATGRTRGSTPGSSASARSTRRPSDEDAPAIFSARAFFSFSSPPLSALSRRSSDRKILTWSSGVCCLTLFLALRFQCTWGRELKGWTSMNLQKLQAQLPSLLHVASLRFN